MNHKELMIGNHVLIDNTTPAVVEEIRCNRSYVRYLLDGKERMAQVEHERSFPVALTEEWLKRAGFEITEFNVYHHQESGRFTYDKTSGWKILENWVRGWVNVQEPKYVHQLQNLFFSLCGTELQFTDK